MQRRYQLLVTAAWLILILPLSWLGYGSDPDAWRIALVAERMWDAGEYIRSRTTGFPLFELAAVPLVRVGSWYATNVFCVAAGLLAIAAMFRIVALTRSRHPHLVLAAFSFAPHFIVNASSTMDYVPALACMLWSLVFVYQRRVTVAALLVGVACGLRPSSALFVIPLTVLLANRVPVYALVRFLIVATLAGVVCYSPALIKYGLFPKVKAIDYGLQSLVLIGGYKYLSLLGIVQSMLLLPLLVFVLIRDRVFDADTVFHLVNIALWTGLFLAMPMEAGYLLPTIPSILLLLDRHLGRVAFAITVVLMLTYNVVQFDVLGGTSGRRSIDPSIRAGILLNDISDRRFKLSTRAAATQAPIEARTILIFGEPWIAASNPQWRYEPDREMYLKGGTDFRVSRSIRDVDHLRKLSEEGFQLIVWDGALEGLPANDDAEWRSYVSVIEDLSVFFGQRVEGAPLNQR